MPSAVEIANIDIESSISLFYPPELSIIVHDLHDLQISALLEIAMGIACRASGSPESEGLPAANFE